mmetsp:Transcript_1723/g.3821  ORF Transcript_1723/g.3821 Transcript_1723/m.3821 type:complete len:652 (+) Transcript_1723:111-2066(+)
MWAAVRWSIFLALPGFAAHLAHLAYDEDAALAFSFVQTGVSEQDKMGMTTMGLHDVVVNLDIEAIDTALGVSMIFDKGAHALRLDQQISQDGIAWGTFSDNIMTTGWSELSVSTNPSPTINNDVKMYSAGYVEGLLTCIRISQFYSNQHQLLMLNEKRSHALQKILGQMKDQIFTMKSRMNMVPHIITRQPDDNYDKQTRYAFLQLWGLRDGYNFAANHFKVHTLSLADLVILNSNSEMPAFFSGYEPDAIRYRMLAQAPAMPMLVQVNSTIRRHDPRKGTLRGSSQVDPFSKEALSDENWEKKVAREGRCTAVIRVTPGDADLFVGHSTWGDYSTMTRIFKHYDFDLRGAGTMASKIAMSSYPGCISSTDEYYSMSSGLVIAETSITNLNPFIWDDVKDFPMVMSIPNFIHLMAVNRLAVSAANWAVLYTEKRANTGTKLSQFMAVDYNVFTKGKPPPDNTLWVVEEVPGAIQMKDETEHLRKEGYFGSYNRPMFESVRRKTGFDEAQRNVGELYSWSDNPRATIMRQNVPGIDNMFSFRDFMIRNRFPNSGVIPSTPGHEIMARFDLTEKMAIPNGGIDAKVVGSCTQSQMIVQAISGPTHANLRPFEWTTNGEEKFPGTPHIGQPDVWNFDWVQMTPEGARPIVDGVC